MKYGTCLAMSSLQQSYLFRSLENAAMQAPDSPDLLSPKMTPTAQCFSQISTINSDPTQKPENHGRKSYRLSNKSHGSYPTKWDHFHGICWKTWKTSTHFVAQFGCPRCFASAFHRGQQASFPQSGHVLRHSESHLAVFFGSDKANRNILRTRVCTMGYQTSGVPTPKVAVSSINRWGEYWLE